jgi:hypothetical protein
MIIKYNPITEYVLNEVDKHGIISPYANFLRSSFTEKLANAMLVINGAAEGDEYLYTTNILGVLDYFGFIVFRGIGIFLENNIEYFDDEDSSLSACRWFLYASFMAVVFIDIIVRFLVATVLTLAVSPLVFMTHLVTLPIRASIEDETVKVLEEELSKFTSVVNDCVHQSSKEDGKYKVSLYGINEGIDGYKINVTGNGHSLFNSFGPDEVTNSKLFKQLGKLNEHNMLSSINQMNNS